jgi:hypothetical protein
MIPVIVISFNNYKYVDNTLQQLSSFDLDVRIMDNNSTCQKTIDYLKTKENVIYNKKNEGPWIDETRNTDLYNSLPDLFIITDPDLQFNKNLPKDFVKTLCYYSDKYNSYKTGFALEIEDFDQMYQDIYVFQTYTIYDWEKRFWVKTLEPDVYEADIDTTFCLVNKQRKDGMQLRLAGNFTARHLPWYINNPFYNLYERYIDAITNTKISTIGYMVKRYISQHYKIINKGNEQFLIKNDNTYLDFWENVYPTWKVELFELLDRILTKEMTFVQIGCSYGETCVYASRISKYVYCVESNVFMHSELYSVLKTNCENYTIVHNCLDTVNDLTKQIKDVPWNIVTTITLKSLIENNKIENFLIYIDLNGGEETILNDIVGYTVLVHFYYDRWKDKNLDRFTFLTDESKESIKRHQNIVMLFTFKTG